MKTLKKIAAGILVAGAALFSQPKAEAGDFSLLGELGFDLKYEFPTVTKIRNIPPEIRNLPRYPGEHNSGRPVQPIQKDYVDLPGRLSVLDFRTGVQASFDYDDKNRIDFRAGAGCNLNFSTEIEESYSKMESAGTRDIASAVVLNQKCDDYDNNGSGGNLGDLNIDYYKVNTKFRPFGENALKPYLFSEIAVVNKEQREESKICCGVKLFQQEFNIQSGWRRSYEDHINREENLGIITILSPYLSWGIEQEEGKDSGTIFAELSTGLSYAVKKEFSELGEKADFDFSILPFFIGGRAGYRF